MNKERNCSIDIFRYVCAIMVVGIHTGIFTEGINYLYRIAVPFFFCVNGYYYMKRLINNERIFWPYIKKILSAYVTWSCFYYLVDLAIYIKNEGRETGLFTLNFAKSLFTIRKDDFTTYPFWYITALIYVVIIVTLMYRLKCHKLIIPISIVAVFFNRLEIQAIYSFGLGYFVLLISQKIKLKNKVLYISWIISVILLFTDYEILRNYINYDNLITIVLFVGCTSLVFLKNPMQQLDKLSKKCKTLSSEM